VEHHRDFTPPPLQPDLDARLYKYCLDDPGDFTVKDVPSENLVRALAFPVTARLGIIMDKKAKGRKKDKSKKKKRKKQEDIIIV